VDTTGEETKPSTVFAGSGAGTETILLVEDDEDVRAVVGEILRSHGYTVLETHDGDQALQLSAVHEGVIHLVVTDLVMPHMGGRELIDRMMPRRPDVRVLFVSGYADDTITDYDALGAGFLEKPFAAPDLVRKVREVLDTPRKGTPATG
jgi:CheY-like chemotaxis protein